MSEDPSTSKGKKRGREGRKLSPPRSFPVEEAQRILEEESSDDDLVLVSEEETDDESDNEDVGGVTQPDADALSGTVVQLEDELGPFSREENVSTNVTKWKDLLSSRTNIPFDCPFRMKTSPSEDTPFAYLLLLFTEEFFDFIVKQTNNYRIHVLYENVQSHSRISFWKETTTAEMKVLMGEVFLMSIIKSNRINDCWRRDYLFNLPFGQFMSRDRFLIILRCMHFASERHSSNPVF